MKESDKRKIEMSKDIVPPEGTREYDEVKSMIDRRMINDPGFRKYIKESQEKALKTLDLQQANGANLKVDKELRYYLNEFNFRSWNYGHMSMPLMFNVMEAFFHLDKSINYWTLLDEEDYKLSFYDFLDYYTSGEFDINLKVLENDLEEDLIYNYNFLDDHDEITFTTSENLEFIIRGVSLVRRGFEVSIMFLTGQKADLKEITKGLKPIDKDNLAKKYLEIAEDRVLEAVALDDNPNLWKVLIACRLDLETKTLDARYIAKDNGNSYSMLTDDPTGFMDFEALKDDTGKETFANMVSKVDGYNSIFELALAVIFLPNYINTYQDSLNEEEVETELKTLIKNPIQQKKYNDVNAKYKIRNRAVWSLVNVFLAQPDKIELLDESFKIERDGYWKTLMSDDIGSDKKGRVSVGRTWVERTLSYMEQKNSPIAVVKKKIRQWGPNAGFIYILRNPSFEKDIFKVGRTQNSTDVRAKQLSNTSVPDRFHIMREWKVENHKQAEKDIHIALEKYRVDTRREFFKVDMRTANTVIEQIIDRYNTTVSK